MKLREKRELKASLSKELKVLKVKLKKLEAERKDLDRPNWQYINAKYNQMALKVEDMQNDIWRLGGKRKTPEVVRFFRTAQPLKQVIFN